MAYADGEALPRRDKRALRLRFAIHSANKNRTVPFGSRVTKRNVHRAKIETVISLTESGQRRILPSITLPKVGRMRANKQMERTTRKRVAGRCFSAATGACC
jgi:hypothetical protein